MTITRTRITQLKANDVPALRERLLENQGGICPICKSSILAPVLDHQHVKRVRGSGLVRGVLCRQCNTFLAKSENSCVRCGIKQTDLPMILRNIADFLETPHLPFRHPTEAKKKPRLTKASYNQLVKAIEKRNQMSPGDFISKKLRPIYPKSEQLTKELEKLFIEYSIIPKFYSK